MVSKRSRVQSPPTAPDSNKSLQAEAFLFPNFFQITVYFGVVLEEVIAVVKTNAHPYGAQLVAFFLSIAPVILVFLFIIVAAMGWRYRTRKRHGPPPRAEIGNIDVAKEEERRH